MQQMAQHEAFLAAVREGDEGQVRSLLQGNPELINACGEAKNTALHIAVLAGASDEVVQCLLGAGADVMARDADGNTALHLASLHPPPDTVVFPHLLSCGGMELLHAANNEGLTALAIAQRANIEWLVAGLQQHDTVLRAMDSDPWRQLEGALQMLSLESFERKVGERGGVNARAFDTGETPLMLALSCGRVDLAQWLVEQGADIHATTRATEKGPATPCLVFALGRPMPCASCWLMAPIHSLSWVPMVTSSPWRRAVPRRKQSSCFSTPSPRESVTAMTSAARFAAPCWPTIFLPPARFLHGSLANSGKTIWISG
jgi:hypothetical protein